MRKCFPPIEELEFKPKKAATPEMPTFERADVACTPPAHLGNGQRAASVSKARPVGSLLTRWSAPIAPRCPSPASGAVRRLPPGPATVERTKVGPVHRDTDAGADNREFLVPNGPT